MNPPVYASCCGDSIIEWRPASATYGPEKDGWAIGFEDGMYGDTNYVAVSYCPFCGVKLPDAPESTNEPA